MKKGTTELDEPSELSTLQISLPHGNRVPQAVTLFEFSMSVVYSHVPEVAMANLNEQVSVRRRKIRFDLILDEQNLADTLARLERDFEGSNVSFWVTPVVIKGLL